MVSLSKTARCSSLLYRSQGTAALLIDGAEYKAGCDVNEIMAAIGPLSYCRNRQGVSFFLHLPTFVENDPMPVRDPTRHRRTSFVPSPGRHMSKTVYLVWCHIPPFGGPCLPERAA